MTPPGPGGGAEGGEEVRDGGFRLFPSDLDRVRRRVYGAVLAFYLAATVGLVWPVYAAFADIRPLVLGMPLSLVYVVLWVVASFLVLLALFLWEGRRGGARGDGDAGSGGGSGPGGRGDPGRATGDRDGARQARPADPGSSRPSGDGPGRRPGRGPG